MKFTLQSNPHMSGKRTTRGIMLELSGVLSVLMICAIVSNFVTVNATVGVHSLVIFILSVLFAVLGDALWSLSTFWDKKNAKMSVLEKFKVYGLKVLDSYGYVSGLIFALLVPNFSSYYSVIVGSFVGTFLAKSIFGGFGKNVFNPALAGRIFVGVCFPSQLVSKVVDPISTEIQTGSTILGNLSGNWIQGDFNLTWQQIFLGNRGGAMGEVLIAVLLIALVYLIVRNIIDWRLSLSYLVTCYVTIFMIGVCSGRGVYSFEFALQHLLVGGILFGAVFCVTDPVTSPTSRYGKVIFGTLAGILTCMIRYQASAPEGVAFSILLCNMVTPLIDRLIKDKSDEHILVKSGVVTGLLGVAVIFGGVYGGVLHAGEGHIQEKAPEFPKFGSAEEQLKYIWTNDFKQEGEVSFTSAEVPTFTSTNAASSTVESKLNFKIEDKDASFYLVHVVQMNLGESEDEVKFTAVVTEEGLVNYHVVSIIDEAGLATNVFKSIEGKYSLENPYTTAKVDEVTQSGATITSVLMQSTFENLINDFGGTR